MYNVNTETTESQEKTIAITDQGEISTNGQGKTSNPETTEEAFVPQRKEIARKRTHNEIAEDILKKYYPGNALIGFLNGNFYLYDFERNHYKLINRRDPREILPKLRLILENECKLTASKRNIGEVLSAMLDLATVQEESAHEINLLYQNLFLTFQDGFYVPRGRFLSKATTKFFTTSSLPINYSDLPTTQELPELEDFKEACRYLADWFGGDRDSIILALQILGYCLTVNTEMQSFFVCYGPAGSGKSTFVYLLQELVGPGSVGAVDWRALTGDNFGLQPLLGKKVGILNDVRWSEATSRERQCLLEKLLAISGEDRVLVNAKFQEARTTSIKAKLMIVSNELPALGDSSGAMARRLISLHFPQTFVGREDRSLKANLKRLLPVFYRMALIGLELLLETERWHETQASKALAEVIERKNNPLAGFVPDVVQEAPGAFETSADIYEAYIQWAEKEGLVPITKTMLTRKLKDALPLTKNGNKKIGKKTCRGLWNVKLK